MDARTSQWLHRRGLAARGLLISMLSRLHITVVLVLIVVVWGCALVVLGLPVTWEYTKPFAITVSFLSAACIAFEKWLWKWHDPEDWFCSFLRDGVAEELATAPDLEHVEILGFSLRNWSQPPEGVFTMRLLDAET